MTESSSDPSQAVSATESDGEGTPEAPRPSFSDLIFHEGFKDKNAGDFPKSLGVELTNYCNLKCPMCPREIATRGYGNMDGDVFRAIADQAAGRRLVFLPTGFGESFIHPDFHELMHYVGRAGVLGTMLITNGTYFTEKNVHGLIDAQLPLVNISLDGTVKEVYEKIRVKANYEEVVENVERFFRLRKERGSKLPHAILRMIRMQETADDCEVFKQKWEPFLEEGDEIIFSEYQTWNGTVEDKRTDTPEGMKAVEGREKKPPCRMIYKTMQVFYDGRTTPCCYDYDCEMEIGNAKDDSISDMWTGERARHFRSLHEEGRMDEIPACRNCQEYIP